MQQNTYLERILSYFTSFDIAKLRLFLKEGCTYQDTTKEIFINKVEKVFKEHKNSGDTELLIYKGECSAAAERCDNCGKKGYRFVGNRSKHYIDLIFETEGDDIKDIYDCSEFKTYDEIENLRTKEYIYINEDEKITFNKTPEYSAKVSLAEAAYSEIITTPPKQLDFKEMGYWLDKHSLLNSGIGSYKVFESKMKWSPFSMLHADLLDIRSYIRDHLEELKKANSLTNRIETEQDLIDWLFKYEATYEEASLELKCGFVKEGEYFKLLNNRNPILFHGAAFIETFSFIEYYHKHYDELFDKYGTYTKEEEKEVIHNPDSQVEYRQVFSLRFHLARRKALEEIGINIPFYINQESNQS